MTWRSDRRRSGHAAGFTLIEILVVLALLGLALAMVAARGPLGARSVSSRAVADRLAADFRGARSRAILRNRPTQVVVDLAGRRWQAGEEAPQAFPPQLDVSVTTVTGLAAGDRAAFRFEPDGSATGGRVVLVDGHRKLQVGIDWLSGRVEVVDEP
jgi:general secretion pathway protein H